MTNQSDEEDSKTLYDEGSVNGTKSSKSGSNRPSFATYTQGDNSLDGSTVVDGEQQQIPRDIYDGLNINGGVSSDAMLAHMKQLKYNQNKTMLDRCIISTIQLINDIKQQNGQTSIYYPLDKLVNGDLNSKLLSNVSKRALLKSKSFSDEDDKFGRKSPTPNLGNFKFELLTIDIKTGINSSSESLLTQFDELTLAKLLNDKFQSIVRHLNSLKDRIDDTNSKVLVTGDLNSGKSSFCNAILRRDVLPTDQQPCTNVFCELISDNENHGIEEVHAVPIGLDYNMRDETTFKRFKLADLHDLVYESDFYSILKIYVKDNRSPERSLLKNGVVDIRLIDAPGLNLDSYQTMQLFSTQEEIDLVVFVVNAENHFTLSGREFISNVNKDKKFSFIVVNKFDNITKKDKCKEKILQQVGDLSPETHKDSQDFVHFVSSKELSKPNGDNDGDGGNDNEPNNEPNGHPDFDHLEASLRNFILDKRSVSKLLPAKNYLTKVFGDLLQLIRLNESHYSANKDEYEVELKLVTPKFEDAVKNSIKINDKIMKLIDDCCNDVYDTTRTNILNTLKIFEDKKSIDQNVTIFNIDQFIQNTKSNIVNGILNSISTSEEYSRDRTSDGIDKIRNLGKEFLGDDSLPKTKFKSEIMYSHKKDYQLKNKINVKFEFVDLVDLDSILGVFNGIQTIFTYSDWSIDKLWNSKLLTSGVSSMVILWSPKIITLISGVGVLFKLPPVVHYSALAVLIGYPIYYLVKESPKTVHRNIIKRIRGGLEEDDYIHRNSLRVSKEVRKVLNYPAKDVSVGLNGLIDREGKLKRELASKVDAVSVNLGFLKKMKGRVELQNQLVSNFDVD